jgi:alpha-tubulin suppressor-like RCC1 family protein
MNNRDSFTPMADMRRHLVLLLLSLGLLACADRGVPTDPAAHVPSPGLTIADAAHGFAPGFYWLPPLVKGSSLGTGTFDSAASPTVEICELAGAVCGPVLVTFTMTSGHGSEMVRLDEDSERYKVNWHTRDFGLSPTKTYRISVRVAGAVIGYADVQPGATGKARKAVDPDEAIALVIGQTLPIAFRIEKGIIVVARVSVTPPEASVDVGATHQFTATVTDSQGSPVTAAVTWASSNTAVATVNQGGLAMAVGPGTTTITATAGQVTGSATLTVRPPVRIVSVSAGGQHNCLLTNRGQAYCWGLGNSGQLGTGFIGQPTPYRVSTPIAVSGGLTFATVDAGSNNTCGVTTAGKAYCWGFGDRGSLGSFTGPALAPTAVLGGLTFASVSPGVRHTCGVTTTGQAYCWGFNFSGQLGTGSTGTVGGANPVAVGGGITFASVEAGFDFSCGLDTAGHAYCWGESDNGRLGNTGHVDEPLPAPVTIERVLVSFASMSVGLQHACAVMATGQAYCWGEGSFGRLGSATEDRFSPGLVSGGLSFASISAGDLHTCALTAAGQAYCWGFGGDGQLGNNTTLNRSVPTEVAGGLTFASINAGGRHTCGLTTDDRVYCWGTGEWGVLGNGTEVSSRVPVQIASLP